ncbi:MAG: ATP-dependent DNA helicase [Acidimicrobiales bacterium]
MPGDDVARLLADVAASLPNGGEDRAGQREMAGAVARAIKSGRHLVVQAGTGTGKSLAYLVPAVASGRKVVVATATKALQDQLAQKDLPALVSALDRAVSFAVLKGRSNYLCLQRAAEVSGHGVQEELSDAAPVHEDTGANGAGASDAGATDDGAEPGRLVDQVRALVGWAQRSETGDRDDLPFEPEGRAWAMLSVGSRECPGAHRCPSGAVCFTERARARAAEADVVVVNTHLYGAHLASGGAVLPPHEVVIFDEAHEVESVMTASLGVEISPGRLRALHSSTRTLVGVDDASATDLSDVAERLRDVLADRAGTRVLHERRADRTARPRRDRARGPAAVASVDAPPPGRDRPFFGLPSGAATDDPSGLRASSSARDREREDGELLELLELAATRVERMRSSIAQASQDEHRGDRDARRAAKRGDDDGQRLRALTAAAHLAEDLQRLRAPEEGEVAWVDGTPRAPVLRLSPVDVAPALASMLWPASTAVLTSATVPSHIEARLGLDAFDMERIDVGSPFDFRSHGLLYVARHLPDRRTAAAEPAIHEELAALIDAAGGRTLALFTSHRAMHAARDALDGRLPYLCMIQGELPKSRLLATFACEESSCLFATLGFWQGVDVPGRACSLVTLDRLPFGRPDDPLLEARRELAGDAAFTLVDLPRAASLLAQGVGRLIRSATDYGVVAVLDPRLATAGYRRTLLAALPPLRRTVDRQEVVEFLSAVLARPARG